MTIKPRFILRYDGVPYVFVSDHPREERMVAVTDDLPLPALQPWDGVETPDSVWFGDPDDDADHD